MRISFIPAIKNINIAKKTYRYGVCALLALSATQISGCTKEPELKPVDNKKTQINIAVSDSAKIYTYKVNVY